MVLWAIPLKCQGLLWTYGVLVQRMFVPAYRVIALGIYCRYSILRRRILTELVFGGHVLTKLQPPPLNFNLSVPFRVTTYLGFLLHPLH